MKNGNTSCCLNFRFTRTYFREGALCWLRSYLFLSRSNRAGPVGIIAMPNWNLGWGAVVREREFWAPGSYSCTRKRKLSMVIASSCATTNYSCGTRSIYGQMHALTLVSCVRSKVFFCGLITTPWRASARNRRRAREMGQRENLPTPVFTACVAVFCWPLVFLEREMPTPFAC
jgi:hypothetical protein